MPTTQPDLRPFYTPRTLAQRLSLSERQARRLIADGDIPSYRVRGSRRVDPDDVDKYLARNRDN
jgi:excisionase family DNA binding protein